MNYNYKAIWAQSRDNIIGDGKTMPWVLPEDLKFFQEVTINNSVLMGKNTWFSLPDNHRPLKNRKNYILTHDRHYENYQGGIIVNDYPQEDIWVIGGGKIYKQLLPFINEIFITEIDISLKKHIGDHAVYAPNINDFDIVSISEWHKSDKGYITYDKSIPLYFRFKHLTRE